MHYYTQSYFCNIEHTALSFQVQSSLRSHRGLVPGPIHQNLWMLKFLDSPLYSQACGTKRWSGRSQQGKLFSFTGIRLPRPRVLVGERTPWMQGWELEFLRSLDQRGETCMPCLRAATGAQDRVESVCPQPPPVFWTLWKGLPLQSPHFQSWGPTPSPPGKVSTNVIWDSLE